MLAQDDCYHAASRAFKVKAIVLLVRGLDANLDRRPVVLPTCGLRTTAHPYKKMGSFIVFCYAGGFHQSSIVRGCVMAESLFHTCNPLPSR